MENKKNSDKFSQENQQEGSRKSSQGDAGASRQMGGAQQGQKTGNGYSVGAGNQAKDDETEGFGVSGTRTAEAADEEDETTGGKSYSSRSGRGADEEGKDPRRVEAGKKSAETRGQDGLSDAGQKGGKTSQQGRSHSGANQ